MTLLIFFIYFHYKITKHVFTICFNLIVFVYCKTTQLKINSEEHEKVHGPCHSIQIGLQVKLLECMNSAVAILTDSLSLSEWNLWVTLRRWRNGQPVRRRNIARDKKVFCEIKCRQWSVRDQRSIVFLAPVTEARSRS